MPALPILIGRIATKPAPAAAPTAEDTRILDDRQIASSASHLAQSLATTARKLLPRISHPFHLLRPRQSSDDSACEAGYIAGCYNNIDTGPNPGAVIGIVLGSVAGFLFLLWLFWLLSQGGSFVRTSRYEEADVVVRHRAPHSPSRRRSRRSSHHSEMRNSPRNRVIREERIMRESVPPPRAPSRVRESVIVDDPREERRVDGDDIVEVIEDHSSVAAPPRRSRRRSSSYRSVVDPGPPPPSGYRRVNPELYAGGDYPQYPVR